MLLHGVGGGRSIWDAAHGGTAEALADAGYWRGSRSTCRATAIRRRWRRSTWRPWRGAVVGSLLRQLGARRAVLLGHSMGGMVAQELVALRADGRARPGAGLHLAAPSASADGDWQQQFLRERLAPLDAGQGMAALARGLVPAWSRPRHRRRAGARRSA